MSFKKCRSIRLPEQVQGFIRYTCLCYPMQPEETKDKIDRMIIEVGGDAQDALRELLCTTKSIRLISHDYYINERRLYRLRKEFYEKW